MIGWETLDELLEPGDGLDIADCAVELVGATALGVLGGRHPSGRGGREVHVGHVRALFETIGRELLRRAAAYVRTVVVGGTSVGSGGGVAQIALGGGFPSLARRGHVRRGHAAEGRASKNRRWGLGARRVDQHHHVGPGRWWRRSKLERCILRCRSLALPEAGRFAARPLWADDVLPAGIRTRR